ncbi:HAD family phosphatase [Streptomyces sp. 3MP-14]|uniref:HAD family phosphatase n=1 Tax=Streptomyces mimosae TaxID=2586635 RepID=A0A5N6A2Y1_9ACTN|nr:MULTISPECIES: HAD family phosphatase [Streptomyces]KAB8162276.1 HAD family phosphatase [Streptomyces mimosae]KAB8173825.1 HAD family phosphatase [Streptomyces sp. 3MP-14]
MTGRLHHLRHAAVNIDGVLLTDTFSPLIHRFITSRGGAYSAEVERRVFSQRRRDAGWALAEAVPQEMTGPQALAAYFAERAAHLAEHPVEIAEGARALLERLRAAGLRLVCYGGLGREHFDEHLGAFTELFDDPVYFCTNDVRPGLREITERLGLRHGEVLFVDDVARVAEEARRLGAPFVGVPSSYPHSHQGELMRRAGVRHLVRALGGIDAALLRAVDGEAAAGTLWADPATDGRARPLAGAAS